MHDAAPLPVTVIGGYLGAGKTTLVNHLLRHNGGRRIAVAVNEFGALPIDSDLIEGADGNVLTLAGGCICCSFGNDLVAGLIDLAARAHTIDHILIEASGVALPGAIAQSLSLVAGLTLDAIVVIVDAETIRARATDFYMGDTITRQLTDADLVVINKTDLISADARAALQQWLPAHAPSARVIAANHAVVAPDIVLGIDSTFTPPTPPIAHVTRAFATESFEFEHIVDADRLAAGLADPAIGLVRAKGFARDTLLGWVTIQVVGQRHHVTAAPTLADASGRIVCIAHGRRFDRTAIEALIAACRPS